MIRQGQSKPEVPRKDSEKYTKVFMELKERMNVWLSWVFSFLMLTAHVHL